MQSPFRYLFLVGLIIALSAVAVFAGEAPKTKIAVFPLAGNVAAEDREHVGFALRTKLNRDGHYDAISGPDVADLVSNSDQPIDLKTSADEVKKLADGSGAQVLVWGEVDGAAGAAGGDGKTTIKLKILDLRQSEPKPREIDKAVNDPTELRFVTEQILETLPGVKVFEHPNETSITLDSQSLKLWAKNPNLVVNGDFSRAGAWDALYQSEKYPVTISDSLPAIDKVCIYRMPGEKKGAKPNNVLAMRLSKDCAENNGMACLSDFIKIQPNLRYRLQFRYKSDGPALHVFVKGYAKAPNLTTGNVEEREIYRRQVPPSGATDGKWVSVLDDANPQRPGHVVDGLRVDLYAYLTPGVVLFDDVVLKAVGKQTDVATDDAIKTP